MYGKIFATMLASTFWGCPYATQEKTEEIESENAALREALSTVQSQMAGISKQLAAVSEQLAEIRSVYQVQDGDAVIEGADLHIRSGQGQTECFPYDECNGKGNLVIGYNEPRHECIGSIERDGLRCSGDNQCPGGTCAPVERPHKTGSHNIIVGPRHTYTGYGSVVLGESSTISGDYVSVLGGSNNTADGHNAVVLGGVANTAHGDVSIVVGGSGNAAAGATSVIVGGSENSTGIQAHSSVVLGHYGHEVTLSNRIEPDLEEIETIPPLEEEGEEQEQPTEDVGVTPEEQ